MNTPRPDIDSYELHRVMVRPLYLGVGVNIFLPALLLLVAFFLDKQGTVANTVGDFSTTLFYIFIVISLADIAAAIFIWQKGLKKPVDSNPNLSIEQIGDRFVALYRPVLIIIALIAVYGFVLFMLTGSFHEHLLLTIVSFLAFQIVRPRSGVTQRYIERQRGIPPSPPG